MEFKAPPIHSPSHYTADVEFPNRLRSVRGFTMKNYKTGMHSQDFYEINIVLRGEAVHFIGESGMKVGVGDTFIIPPDIMHGYDGGRGFDVYHILISPRHLEKNGAELQHLPAFSSLFRMDPLMRKNASMKLHFRLTPEEMEKLYPALLELAESTLGESAADAVIANHEALVIIAWLCDIYEKHGIEAQGEKAEDYAFMSSIAYIYESFKEKITIDALARMANMSRTAYIEKFKRVVGVPPASFIRSHRIQMAKQLLSEGVLSEAEIAAEVGLTDTSHLIKLFTSEVGMTPSLYRKSLASSIKSE